MDIHTPHQSVPRSFTRALACGLLLLTAAAVLACGGSARHLRADPQTWQAALAELQTAPAPAGVDAARWQLLKASLASALRARGEGRAAAAAPDGPGAVVDDLAFERLPDESVVFSWSYRNPGDYDRNGEVNIGDLVPVGQYFGAASGDPGWEEARLADGDGNGEINLSDVTPIGAGYGASVGGYQLQCSASSQAPEDYSSAASLPFAAATVDGSGNLVFSLPLRYPQWFRYFRVVPYSTAGPAELGAPSPPLMLMGAQWGSAAGGPAQQRCLEYPGPQRPELRWQLQLSGAPANPVIGPDGTLYLRCGSDVTAIDAAGAVLWTANAGSYSGGALAVSNSGLICTADHYDTFAFDADGSSAWTAESWSPYILGFSGRGTLLQYNSNLLALSGQGEQLWQLEGVYPYGVCWAADGSLYFSSTSGEGNHLVQLGEDGTQLGSYALAGLWPQSLARRPDGRLLCLGRDPANGSESDRSILTCLSQTGEELWRQTIPVDPEITYARGSFSEVAVRADSSCVLACQIDYLEPAPLELVSYSAQGAEQWRTLLLPPTIMQGQAFAPQVDSQGSCYLAINYYDPFYESHLARLCSYDQAGSLRWAVDLPFQAKRAPVIDAAGNLYVVDEEAMLYCYGGAGLAPPFPPAELTASDGVYSDHVELSWQPSASATSYRVYRDTLDTPVMQTEELQWDDYTLPDGGVHTYWVSGLNASGEGIPGAGDSGRFEPAHAGVGAGDWRMADHDCRHTRRSNVAANEAGTFSVSSRDCDYHASEVVCGGQGYEYLAEYDGSLLFLQDFDTIERRFELGYSCFATPAVGADGTIHIALRGNDVLGLPGRLCAVNSDRTLKWIQELQAYYPVSPVVAPDGTIYQSAQLDLGEYRYELIACAPDGSVKWRSSYDAWISSAAVDASGAVYICAGDAAAAKGAAQGAPGPGPPYYYWTLHKLSPAGELQWSLPGDRGELGTPVIADDGRIYVLERERILLAVAPDGELLWERELPTWCTQPAIPAAGQDYALVVYSNAGILYAINGADGALVWALPLGSADSRPVAPLIDANGTIFAVSGPDCSLFKVSAAGEILDIYPVGSGGENPLFFSLSLADDGALWIQDNGLKLYRVVPGS